MNLASDFRYSLRQVLRRPGFSLAVIGTLALGIAAALTMFSITHAVVFKPLPYDRADRAVMIWSSWKDFPQTWVSYDEYEAYREEIPAFETVGIAYSPVALTVGGTDDPELVQASAITLDTLRALGIQPVTGRDFAPAEDVPGGEPVAIIGFDLWQRRYHADPEIVGRVIDFSGIERRVVGVLPARFRMPFEYGTDARTEVLFPLAADPTEWEAVPGPEFSRAGGAHTFYAFARLADGATVEQANAQLLALTRRLGNDGVYPEGWDFRARAVSLPTQVVGQLRPALWVLGAGVALLLAIACANVAGLMLIRGEHRRREFGIRTALGAGPVRLVRQLAMESLLLAGAAGLGGLVLGWTAIRAVAALVPDNLPRVGDAQIDPAAFAFAMAMAFLAALLAALVPSLQAARTQPARTVRDDSPAHGHGVRLGRGRSLLVAGEIALAVVLTMAAGLMIRSVSSLLDVDPGFEAANVVTMRIALPSSRYPEDADVARYYGELDRRLSALPGVDVAGAVRVLPLDSEIGDMGVQVDGYQPAVGESSAAEWQVVVPGYFEALGIERISGRLLDQRDGADRPALVVNRRFVEQFFADRDPLGRPVTIGGSITARIVGVVADTRHNGLMSEIRPRFYASHAVAPQRTMNVVVRSEAAVESLAGALRAEVRAMDPRLAVSEVRRLSDIVADVTARPRFVMATLSAFAGVALTLGAIGLYAVLAYFVSRSTREIGIRMSLGARRQRIFLDVMGRGMMTTLVGAALGLAAAFALSRFLSSMLVGVTPADPVTFLAVVILFVFVGATACALPALRATGVHPAAALRHE